MPASRTIFQTTCFGAASQPGQGAPSTPWFTEAQAGAAQPRTQAQGSWRRQLLHAHTHLGGNPGYVPELGYIFISGATCWAALAASSDSFPDTFPSFLRLNLSLKNSEKGDSFEIDK